MHIIDDLDEMIKTARGWLAGGKVSFVPVANNLHEGHTALIQAAQQASEICVVGLINKAELFDAKQDPPRHAGDLTRDLRIMSNLKVDIVFIPRAEDMYPSHTFATYATPTGPLIEHVKKIQAALSVQKFATTMLKLLQLVRPDIAVVGQKDVLQVAIIRQLIRDFNIDVGLQVLPTVREQDGLACSSHNQLFSPAERQAAAGLNQALRLAQTHIESGERQVASLEKAIMASVSTQPLLVLTSLLICHTETFLPVSTVAPGTLLMIGARVDSVQLTDNIAWMSDGQWRV